MGEFVSPKLSREPCPLKKTAGDNRKPQKGFNQESDKMEIADGCGAMRA